MPSQYGFKRNATLSERGSTLDELGNLVEGKQRIDIYYYPPVGKRLRSPKEVEEYLSKHQPAGSLSMKNFSFKREILDLGEFETVSQAKSSRKKGHSNKAAEIRNKETPASDPENPKMNLHIHCEELGRETTISVRRGKLLKKVMRKFRSEVAGLEGPKQLVFLCAGKKLKESDRVDSLPTNKIDVQVNERGN